MKLYQNWQFIGDIKKGSSVYIGVNEDTGENEISAILEDGTLFTKRDYKEVFVREGKVDVRVKR